MVLFSYIEADEQEKRFFAQKLEIFRQLSLSCYPEHSLFFRASVVFD